MKIGVRKIEDFGQNLPIHLFLVLFIHLTIKHVLRKIIDTLCTKRPKIFRFILIETQTKHFDTRLQLP